MYNVSVLPRVQLSVSNLLLLYPCILQNCYKKKKKKWSSSSETSLLRERPEGPKKSPAVGTDHKRLIKQPNLLSVLHSSLMNDRLSKVQRLNEIKSQFLQFIAFCSN